MADKNFEMPPLAVINNLRANLRDRYQGGFAILKELIQNADDARALNLHLGWTSGLANVDGHPLLGCPALFVVNDGKFDAGDARAIRQIGLSSKSGDAGTIGRFGLGLKSVFQVCEVFYYLSSAPPGDRPAADVLNPWSPPSDSSILPPEIQQRWDEFTPAQQGAMQGHLTPLLENLSRWFILWLPLRTSAQHTQADPPIFHRDFDHYAGPMEGKPDEIFLSGCVEQIAATLPMLESLNQVCGWRVDANQRHRLFGVRLAAGSTRCLKAANLRQQGSTAVDLAGKVLVERSAVPIEEHLYGGKITLVDTPEIGQLSRSSLWPLTSRLAGTRAIQEKEKADPHCGVCWMRRPPQQESKQLDYSWAVFLPLSDQPCPQPINGDFACTLLLHGCLLIDAGRLHFDRAQQPTTKPANEVELRHSWNHFLTTQGTLPLLPKALEQFCRVCAVNDEQARCLTAAFVATPFFKGHRPAICQRHQWVYRWEAIGPSWKCVESSETLLELPDPLAHPDLPAQVFPDLGRMVGTANLVYEAWPRLARPMAAAPWPAAWLFALLESVPAEALFNLPGGLDYLARFLERLPLSPSAEVLQALRHLVRRCLAVLAATDTAHQGILRRIIARLPPESRRGLPLRGQSATETTAAESVRLCLSGLALAVVVVPAHLEPEDDSLKGTGLFGVDDAVGILRALAEVRSQENARATMDELRSRLARQVLTWAPELRTEVLHQCADCHLFRAQAVTADALSDRVYPFAQLQHLHQRGALFTAEQPSAARALRCALPGEAIVLLGDGAEILFGRRSVFPCDTIRAVALLLRQRDAPTLGDPAVRGLLLDYLIRHPLPANAEQNGSYRQAVRLLLHGQREHADSEQTLLIDQDGDGQMWSRIVHAVLQQQRAGWRLIARVLSGRIPESQRGHLGLEIVQRASAIRLLEAGPSADLALPLTAQQRDDLLRDLEDQPRLLRSLRIHAEDTGRPAADDELLHTIGEGCYFQGAFPLPDELRQRVKVLRLSPVPGRQAVQLTLAPRLDAQTALDIAWTVGPQQHQDTILRALAQIATPDVDLVARLRSTAWLAHRDGKQHINPGQVINLPRLREELARVVSRTAQDLVDPSALHPRILQQPLVMEVLNKHVFLDEAESLGYLGMLLGDNDEFHIGVLQPLSAEKLHHFIKAFQGIGEDLLPAYPVLCLIDEHQGRGPCVDHLLPNLRRSLLRDRLVKLLGWLRQQHQNRPADRRSLLEVHNWYLQDLCQLNQGDDFRALLAEGSLSLLNRMGHWRSPAELCIGSDNITPEDRLDEGQLALVHKALPQPQRINLPANRQDSRSNLTPEQVPQKLKESAERLRNYFDEWLRYHHGLHAMIGGFLATLGNHPDLRHLADQRLRPGNTVDVLRQRLRLHMDVGGMTPAEMFDRVRVLVEITEGTTVAESSLTGQPLPARLASQVQELFVRYPISPFREQPGADGTRWLRLRAFDPAQLAEEQLANLLQKASELVLREIYNEGRPDLSELFRSLGQTRQQAVRIAQNMLLEHAPYHLRQLQLQSHPLLRDLLQRMHDARYLAAAEDNLPPGAPRRARDEQVRLQREFRRLMEGEDSTARQALLTAIRGKIAGDYQYSETSVPFEMFQNADDANGEVALLGAAAGDWFAVEWDRDAGVLRFMHLGRGINQTSAGPDVCTGQGFESDLEKMLMPGSSDKPAEQGPFRPTGKFGLGFKSIYLLGDEPCVVSGPLAFRVIAGLYPVELDAVTRHTLMERFEQVHGAPGGGQGTLFEIALSQPDRADRVLRDFVQLLPVLLVFAQCLHRCDLVGIYPERHTVQAVARCVPGTTHCKAGRLSGPANDFFRNRPVLQLELAERSSLLLALDDRGVTRLPDEVPAIWVTAPTQEFDKVGFALNAPFDVDAGRAQLARQNEPNERLADQLGRNLGDVLVELFDAGRDHWREIVAALALTRGADQADFWQSLWRVLGEQFASRRHNSDGLSMQLLGRVLWERQHGLARLYMDRPALPTGIGLMGYNTLTSIGRIRAYLTGCLDEEADLFSRVAGWAGSSKQKLGGEMVSEKRIWSVLQHLCPSLLRDADPVNLCRIVEWELDANSYVSVDQAVRLGQVLTPKFLQRLEGTVGTMPEAKRLRDSLMRARFRSQTGGEEPASRLLLDREAPDDLRDRRLREEEVRRAAFAPSGRILHSDYHRQGAAAFFLACRGNMEAPLDDLVEWAGQAEGAKRQALLEYLHTGELAPALGRRLQQFSGGAWWCQQDEFQAAAHGFTDQAKRWAQTFLDLHPEPAGNGVAVPPPPPPPPDPQEALDRIGQQWQRSKAELMARYLRFVYPPFLHQTLTDGRLVLTDEDAHTDLDVRKRWLGLFILGMLHNLGRGGRHFEQHRDFLQLTHDQGWLDVFAEPGGPAQRWLAIIDDYVDKRLDDIRYYAWLRQLFVSIRVVARQLPDYVDVFRNINNLHRSFSLGEFLRTRTSPLFQGGGVDAPSLGRVLGLGACFVVRELVRGRFLVDRPQVHEHCFPPVGSVRRLLEGMGCAGLGAVERWNDSRIIFAFLGSYLGDPTFAGAYDIPLWLASREQGLIEEDDPWGG